LRNEIVKTKSKVLIIVGEKELGIMKKSAKYLHEKISDSQLYVISQMGHGEISLVHPIEYVNIIKTFFAK
jgi:pimeloyl-ACP methyl ester carboxylesterase